MVFPFSGFCRSYCLIFNSCSLRRFFSSYLLSIYRFFSFFLIESTQIDFPLVNLVVIEEEEMRKKKGRSECVFHAGIRNKLESVIFGHVTHLNAISGWNVRDVMFAIYSNTALGFHNLSFRPFLFLRFSLSQNLFPFITISPSPNRVSFSKHTFIPLLLFPSNTLYQILIPFYSYFRPKILLLHLRLIKRAYFAKLFAPNR